MCVCMKTSSIWIMVFSPHVVLPVGREPPPHVQAGREYQHENESVLNTRVRRTDPNTRECTPSLKSDSEAQSLVITVLEDEERGGGRSGGVLKGGQEEEMGGRGKQQG